MKPCTSGFQLPQDKVPSSPQVSISKSPTTRVIRTFFTELEDGTCDVKYDDLGKGQNTPEGLLPRQQWIRKNCIGDHCHGNSMHVQNKLPGATRV